jgi:flagellar L-ring protein precursor FlgH
MKTVKMSRRNWNGVALTILLFVAISPLSSQKATGKSKNSPMQLRTDYLSQLHEQDPHADSGKTVGSLWSPVGSPLGDISADFKARQLNDTIVILASVQTAASQTGTSGYQRTVKTSSAITGLAGAVKTTGLNPLFNANSATQLAGQGATASNTTFQTSLTGEVIAVLPSGNLVVEAQRKIFMNNQHEDVIVRGVVRPGDIGPNNTVSSASLSNLQIEMKGKGIIADSTRPLNPITKALLWLIGF